LESHAANATARGPSCAPAAPGASEVCSGWRGWTLRPHDRQRPTCTSNRVVNANGSGKSSNILDRNPLQDQPAAAARATSWQPDGDDLVDPLGRLPVRMPAVGRAGPAPGTLGLGLGLAPGERGSLTLGRPAQRLHLGAQPLVGLPEPLALHPQPVVLLTQPLAFGLQPLVLTFQPLLLDAQRGVLVLEAPMHSCNATGPANSRTAPEPTATIDTKPGGYNRPIRRQRPAISIPVHLGECGPKVLLAHLPSAQGLCMKQRSGGRYRIVLRGELGDQFQGRFGAMVLERKQGLTVLTGHVVDQAQLLGLVQRGQEFGVELVSVEPLDDPQDGPADDDA
jgi:hypothetical protein